MISFETPQLDLSGSDAPETLLRRIKTQNFALDRLRDALNREEFSIIQNA